MSLLFWNLRLHLFIISNLLLKLIHHLFQIFIYFLKFFVEMFDWVLWRYWSGLTFQNWTWILEKRPNCKKRKKKKKRFDNFLSNWSFQFSFPSWIQIKIHTHAHKHKHMILKSSPKIKAFAQYMQRMEDVAILSTLWVIWLRRNLRIYEDRKRLMTKLWRIICLFKFLWISITNEFFRSPFSMIFHGLSLICILVRKVVDIEAKWTFLVVGVQKLNFD